MEIIQLYAKELFSIFVTFFAWALNNRFKARANLQLTVPHSFTFLLPVPLHDAEGVILLPNQTVHTASRILTNAGRETATNIELVFNWKPLCINIWLTRHYQEHLEEDGRYVMIFDSLAPNEQIGFELLSINGNLPDLINARSDQCTAKTVEMYLQPVLSKWKIRLLAILLFLGFSAAIYIIILVLQFLMLATPYGH